MKYIKFCVKLVNEIEMKILLLKQVNTKVGR